MSFLSVDPVIHWVQHKIPLDKTMAIASTVFVPVDNNVTKGGTAHLYSLTCVGEFVVAN